MLEWLWLVMFGVTFALIFLGYPVAFALGGTAVLFSGLGIHYCFFRPAWVELFPERLFGVMSNQVLLAVPFFIFMGTLLQKSRLAEDLLRTADIAMYHAKSRGLGFSCYTPEMGRQHARRLDSARRLAPMQRWS